MTEVISKSHSRRQAEIGLVYGIIAYAWWGLIPLYFRLMIAIPPLLVLAHRVLWSFAFMSVLCFALKSWPQVMATLRSRRTVVVLAISTVMLATNWGVFIYAITTNNALQASLGYFIVPLVSVVLAIVVLKERLRPGQAIGVAIAAVGVIVLTIARQQLPWIALTIAFSWSTYALLRKLVPIGPIVGVTVETALLVPVAAGYITWQSGTSGAAAARANYYLLMMAGVVTALPLLWFAASARRLRLITLGFLQYIAPIGQFLCAVIIFREKFGAGNFIGFGCIWLALIIYSIDSLRGYRAFAPPPAVAEI